MSAADELPGFESFLERHLDQLQHNNVPESLYERVYEKLSGQVFDAGAAFMFDHDPNREGSAYAVVCCAENGLAATSDIWLVDHMWTFTSFDEAQVQLAAVVGLLSRVAQLMELEDPNAEPEDLLEDDERLEKAIELLPSFTLQYKVLGPDGSQDAYYYVLDELGSRFRLTADDPNFAFAPFLWLDNPGGPVAFTIIYPIRDVEHGEECTRDLGTVIPLERGEGESQPAAPAAAAAASGAEVEEEGDGPQA